MTLDDRAGNRQRRTLRGPDCADVAHALAFLAGLAIDLAPAEAAPPASPPRVVAAAPVVCRAAVAASACPAPIRSRNSRRRESCAADWPTRLAPSGASGSPSRISGRGGSPTAGIAIVGGGGGMTGQRGSADLWLLGGRLSFCPLRLLPAGVELRPCAAGEVGSVWARATTLVNPPSVRRPWLSAEATLSVRWPQRGRVFADSRGGRDRSPDPLRLHVRIRPGPAPLRRPRRDRARAAGVGYRYFDGGGPTAKKENPMETESTRPMDVLKEKDHHLARRHGCRSPG